MENVEETGVVPGPGASLPFVASVAVLCVHPYEVPFSAMVRNILAALSCFICISSPVTAQQLMS
jgi:hypothetical protein